MGPSRRTGAGWSPCQSLFGLTCLPPSQPPVEAPGTQAPRLGFTTAPSRQGRSEEQGSLLLCGQQRAAGLPQGHHNLEQHLPGKPHWLFSTQINILGDKCPQHTYATLLCSFLALGRGGWAGCHQPCGQTAGTHHSLAVWPWAGHPTSLGSPAPQHLCRSSGAVSVKWRCRCYAVYNEDSDTA